MSEEILINVTPQETRVAVVENGILQEVLIERARSKGLVGNIYVGRVSRVLPGMQAAFVDIGLERAAFLHASDISAGANSERQDPDVRPTPGISELVREGQQISVQVIKDPLGTKGARLTTQLSIPARFLVYMPGASHIGVSQKIEVEEEKLRLRELVTKLSSAQASGGYIIRTVAEGQQAEGIESDINFLQRLWLSINERMSTTKAPALIHEDLPLAMRAIRDILTADVDKVRIDSRETYQKAEKFVTRFIPEIKSSLEYYSGPRPLFDLYGAEEEIQKALQPRVQLKSGGHLVIDQTEAMTTIDVNTGAYVGNRNLEETIFKTNLEATQAIARQLRLRNLGGIIIIDFIDMAEEEHKIQVLAALEKGLVKDHTKTHISSVSSLGLVEMTRKRTRESLQHILCETCPTCGGRGMVKTPETVCYEIFREILREARQFDAQSLLVLVSAEVSDMLLENESTAVADLEAFIERPIRFQVETQYTQEHYDVVLM